MCVRLIALALAAIVLAGCSTVGCDASANNDRSGGGCTAHVTFLH